MTKRERRLGPRRFFTVEQLELESLLSQPLLSFEQLSLPDESPLSQPSLLSLEQLSLESLLSQPLESLLLLLLVSLEQLSPEPS